MNRILELKSFPPRVRATPHRTESRAFCLSCQKPVDLMSIEKSADFFKTNLEDIALLTQKIILHPIHNSYGKLMICTESLFAFFAQRKTQILDKKYLSVPSLAGC